MYACICACQYVCTPVSICAVNKKYLLENMHNDIKELADAIKNKNKKLIVPDCSWRV